MAPIRRYLRITKYSVLEVRIYLDNPALAQTWLLNARNPVLPRVIESVRPLVLPKLREERERSRKRSTKKKGIKDVVVEDDFEVSIFLTETSTRHSLLTKHKHFHDKTQTKLTSNSGRLIAATNEAPIDVNLAAAAAPINLRREDSDVDAPMALDDIPMAPAADTAASRPLKRARRNTVDDDQEKMEHDTQDSDFEVITSDEDDAAYSDPDGPPAMKRRKETMGGGDNHEDKKLDMDISYEGFAIYGRVLCLVVKRRNAGPGNARGGPVVVASGSSGNKSKQGGGQTMMENFIISTQIPAGEDSLRRDETFSLEI